MNAVPALFILALCAAAGGLGHHLTETGAAARPPARQLTGARTASSDTPRSRAEAVSLADELLALTASRDTVNWVHLDGKLSTMAPSDYLLVLRELAGREKNFLRLSGALLPALVERAAAADAKRLIAFAEETGDFRFLSDIVRACFPHDPAAALAAIQRFESAHKDDNDKKNEIMVHQLWGSALACAYERDPVTALSIAERSGVLEMTRELDGLKLAARFDRAMKAWVEKDSAAAVAFALRHPTLLKTAIASWGGNDLEAATAWLRGSPERMELVFGKEAVLPPDGIPSDESDPFAPVYHDPLEALYYEYAKKHPVEAARFLDHVSDRSGFYQCLAEGMAGRPVEEAAAWVQTLSKKERLEAASTILRNLELADPAQAFAFYRLVPEMIPPTGIGALDFWSRREPAETAEFLRSAPLDESVRNGMMSWLMNDWLKNDREAALAYVQTQPSSEWKGCALLEASQILTDGGRAEAFAWAMTLPDLSQRLGACREILAGGNGAPLDAEQTAQWIAKLPDAALRDALRKPVPVPAPEPEQEPPDAGTPDPFGPSDPFQPR